MMARAIIMLIVSVLVGLVVTALAVSWVAQRGSIASNKVAVAIMNIELGSRLNSQMLTTIDWPSGSIPDGVYADLKELQDRVVKTSIQKGEAILSSKLAPVGSQGGLSAVIAKALSNPPRTCPPEVAAVSIIISMLPANRSCEAGPALR